MAAFVFKKSPEPVPDTPFLDASGKERSIKDWAGKVVLLNLWATWCAPCRKEMPSLDRLQAQLGSDRFEVVAVSVDKTGIDGAKKFLDDIKVAKLGVFADPTIRLGTALKAIGMPSSLIIDAQGRVFDTAADVAVPLAARTPVGQLKLVQFEGSGPLQRLDGGLVLPAGEPVLAAEGSTEVRQGFLENANVSQMHEMVELLQTVRHMESMQKVALGYDEMLGTTIRRLGEGA